jgi:hypothetical protein
MGANVLAGEAARKTKLPYTRQDIDAVTDTA